MSAVLGTQICSHSGIHPKYRQKEMSQKYLESTLQQRRPVGGAGRVPRGKKEVEDIVKIRTFCINQNSTGD